MIRKLGLGRELPVVGIFNYRINEFALGLLGFVVMKSFSNAPAVVPAFSDQIHLLPFVLTDVGRPQLAGFLVKTHSPHVAQTIGPNLRPYTFRFGVERVFFGSALVIFSHERIVLRYAIRKLAGARVHVNAQDLGQQVVAALSDAVGIAAQAAVAGAEVKIAVRAEDQGAA